MKKKLLIAVLAVGLLIPAIFAGAELLNITAKGVDGDLVYYDASGNEIMSLEAANRLLTFPSGSGIDVESGASLKLGGTAITATAAQINDVTAGKVAVSSKAFTAGEDWELSATEAKSAILVVSSGSGTPSIVDQYVSAGTVKLFRNASNVAVTIKASGGTGVSVASGKTAVVMCVGTDYVRATADATH